MILLREFNPETEKLLMRFSKGSKFARVRNRSQCIILTDKRFSSQQLMKIFRVSLKTLNNWWTIWERKGIIGLDDAKGKGRKSTLNKEQQEQVK
ncbi:MAG: helix-turn-helix domain-containing protein [Moorea sp. SIO2B7]|nr:helix-turn-helix domain-containing protein [Moorena sp. SIO2B7]